MLELSDSSVAATTFSDMNTTKKGLRLSRIESQAARRRYVDAGSAGADVRLSRLVFATVTATSQPPAPIQSTGVPVVRLWPPVPRPSDVLLETLEKHRVHGLIAHMREKIGAAWRSLPSHSDKEPERN